MAAFDKYRDRVHSLMSFLVELTSVNCEYTNLNNEDSYTRYINISDRLGRTSIHLAFMHGLSIDILTKMIVDNGGDLSLEDIDG